MPAKAANTKEETAVVAAESQQEKQKNHVRVSAKTNKFRYVDIVKYLLNEGETHVDISGLAVSITPVVEICEILKSQGLVEVTKIETSRTAEGKGRPSDRLLVRVVKASGFQKVFDEQQAARKAAKDKKDAEEEEQK